MRGATSPYANTDLPRHGPFRRLWRIGGAFAMSGLLLVPSASYAGTARTPVGTFSAAFGRGPAIARGRAMLLDAARIAAAHPRSQRAALPRLSTGFKGSVRSTAPTRIAAFGPSPRLVNTTPPTDASSFPGLTSADNSAGQEPPDPWVAVNASYVVQSVNSVVRISTRAGVAVQTLPDWALFALPNDQTPSDPRIIWDAFHGRWLGSLVSYNSAFTQNYLNLAVSETSDPLGAWDTYAIDTGGELPDYPAIASSTDRIVLTADDFELWGSGYQGSEIDVIAWSQVLTGVTVTPALFLSNNSVAHPRPAQVLSSSAIVHVIYEALSSGDVLYLKINGTATAPTITDAADLSVGLGLAPFTLPPAPHNTDGTTITKAVDERPTDAVWRNGRLWFVATYSTGAPSDGARATEVTTGTTSPVSGFDLLIAAAGWDLYMPGAGITSDDTAVIVMTASGTGLRNPTTVATRWTAADGFDPTLPFFDTSDDTYGGTRWGDFVGVASDPALPGSAWVADEVAAADHTWRTTVIRFALPSVSAPPTQSLVTPSAIPTVTATLPRPTVPVRIAWGGSLAGLSGAQFQVSQNVDGAGFETFASTTTATSFVRSLAFGHSYQFEVRVRDAAGNTSAWQTGPAFTPFLYQETSALSTAKVTYTGIWGSQASAAYSGGTAKYASAANASATFTATGVHGIGFVTTKATTRGSIKIYVDGVYKGTFSPSTAPTVYRDLFYQFSWSTAGTHSIKVVVVGTAGHPRVDVDAFVVLQ